jgi:hypothetical protein
VERPSSPQSRAAFSGGTMVTKTQSEYDQLSPSEKRQYWIDEENTVFGVGHRKDRHGVPESDGIGSKHQPTKTHVEAIRKYYVGTSDKDKAEVLEKAIAENKAWETLNREKFEAQKKKLMAAGGE